MDNIAIIPARGGSQRIPRKNIKDFLGVPIIQYSIDAAKATGIFDMIMVSTEDEEIAEISKGLGASVPFLRSKEAAAPDAPMYEAIRETLAELSARGQHFENCCMIYATAPMIDAMDIRAGYDTMLRLAADVCVSVVRSPWHFQRAMVIEDGRLRMIFPQQKDESSNTWFEDYHHAEHFWWMSVPRLMINGTLFPPKAAGHIIPCWKATPIDTEEDWEEAQTIVMLREGLWER